MPLELVHMERGDFAESISLDESRFLVSTEQIWDMDNFLEMIKGQTVYSAIFDGDSKGESKWRMSLKREMAGERVAFVDVGLALVECGSSRPLKAEYQLNFLDLANEVIVPGDFIIKTFIAGEESCTKFPFRVIRSECLINSASLRLHCQISTKTTLNLKRKRDAEEEEYSVKRQFRSIFTNGDFADVILKTETTSFPACKVILAAHSPVFSAMFSSDMVESKQNVVTIEDCSDEAVKAFLEFMYTGETSVLEENPKDLLKISDKYQVMELKKKAEAVILKSLTIQNAVEILILAHFHSPTTLKPKVIGFVNLNSKDIQQTPAFKEMAGKFPELVLDLYTQVTSLYMELSSNKKLQEKS